MSKPDAELVSITREAILQLWRGQKVFLGDVVIIPTPPLPSDETLLSRSNDQPESAQLAKESLSAPTCEGWWWARTADDFTGKPVWYMIDFNERGAHVFGGATRDPADFDAWVGPLIEPKKPR